MATSSIQVHDNRATPIKECPMPTPHEALAAATSMLFVPGHRPDRFAKAAAAGAGAIILDLEDAVAPDAKDEAREHVVAWLAKEPEGLAVVRINAPGTPWYDDDVDAIGGLTGTPVMLPKAETHDDVYELIAVLGEFGVVLPLIETAAGVLGAREILSVPGVLRPAFGSIDLSAQLGVDPTDNQALLFARSRLVLAAAAAGVAGPLDGVNTDINDEAALTRDSRHAAGLGFTGKMCIHPRQLDGVRAAFSPTEEELAWARRVLDAAGDGAVTVLDGKMIDKPVVDRARRILARA
jgi:citrate lyase subunit beta/citryl-CoA lyase